MRVYLRVRGTVLVAFFLPFRRTEMARRNDLRGLGPKLGSADIECGD
jgi:hypothetical protein